MKCRGMYRQPVEAPYVAALAEGERLFFVLCYKERVSAMLAKGAVDVLQYFSALSASYDKMAHN
jgi:hypothetical protein